MDEITPDIFGLIGWAVGLFIALGSYRQGKANAAGSLAEATSLLLNPLLARIKSLQVTNTSLEQSLKDCLADIKQNSNIK